MALTNRLGVVNWTLVNDVITLSSSLQNQKRLEEQVGVGFFEWIAEMDKVTKDADGNAIPKVNPLARMAQLFYFLQVGTDYSADEIYGCFFGDISAYPDGDFEKQNSRLFNHLFGNKESEVLNNAAKDQPKGN